MISVNEYFDARVKSLGYTTTTGKSTVGVMEEGEYEFGTSTHETMIVIEGELIAPCCPTKRNGNRLKPVLLSRLPRTRFCKIVQFVQ
jgi:uncharacterized protein YaiE (UPF0345 family)